MSPKDTRPPWSPSSTAPGLAQVRTRPLLPTRGADVPGVQSAEAMPSDASDLTEAEYRLVGELRDRVSTRLTAEDKNYAAGPRRELTKKLIRDEYDSWLLHEANRGRAAPAVTTEDRIFAAVLAELDGLGRLAPLLARDDVEDIHFEGCDPTMLRTVDASRGTPPQAVAAATVA